MTAACRASRFPLVPIEHGFFAFGTTDEINELFPGIGRFRETIAFDLLNFIAQGAPELELMGK
ncbi:MAG: hypothetical protein AB7S93_26790, partial [Xanthobacteraceae bacterium]